MCICAVRKRNHDGGGVPPPKSPRVEGKCMMMHTLHAPIVITE